MVIMRHHFCQEINKDGQLEEILSVVVSAPKANFPFPFDLVPFLENWDATKLTENDVFKPTNWKYGNELELIRVNNRQTLKLRRFREAVDAARIKAFKSVSTNFKIEIGMRVGILARSCFGLAAKNLRSELRGGEENYQPQPGDTFIKVGTISYVGCEHIEYDINTAPGFSGGPVVLLNKDSDCHMKVVASHAGYSEHRGMNFGFLIAEKLESRKNGGFWKNLLGMWVH